MKNSRYIIILLILACLSCHRTRKGDESPDPLLITLDSLIMSNEILVENKERMIDFYRSELGRARTAGEKISLSGKLFDEYKVYDSDSALHYAQLGKELLKSNSIEDYNLEVSLDLDEVFILAVQGKFTNAGEIIDKIDVEKLNPDVLFKYYQTKEYIYSLTSIFLTDNADDRESGTFKSCEYLDSISSYPASYLPWAPVAKKVSIADIKGRNFLEANDSDILKLKEIVDNETEPSRVSATNAYWLSRYYKAIGDKKKMLHYLTQSAILDARIVNREIAAVEELASELFAEGDINRAFMYLTYALNEINLYKNRSRLQTVYKSFNEVRDAYEEEIHKRDSGMHKLIVSLSIVASILLLTLFFIGWEYRKLNRLQKSLSEVNDSLKKTVESRDKAIEQLKEANIRLTEANERNMGLLTFIIRISTGFMSTFENYRKTLLVKFKGKKTGEVDSMLSNPDSLKQQYQEFYKNLDKTILTVFPNFREEYNAGAPSDQQMSEEDEKTGTLSTRMRVYGLRKLGVEKSSEIAQMLNISIRTVYNNR